MNVKVKICCISSWEEAQIAIDAGAHALGLVGPMPSGPGVIRDEQIAEIAARAPRHIRTFLLTSETTAEQIIAHHERTGTTTIQLVDQLEKGGHVLLQAALPDVELVQVIHVLDERSLTEAQEITPYVDALLLDSGNPNLAVKELGGTGRTHNWAISRQIVRQSPIPVYLAGGLRAANVSQAVDQVQPFGLDLCSGVRTNGRLDPQKLTDFFAALGDWA